MTRRLALCVALLTALAGLASPARAQAPAPKVTIEGFFDFEASLSKNWSDADITNARDTLGYTRERGRLFFIGEVGKSKMEWALELDFTNGAGVGNTTPAAPGTSASLDLDTDVAGFTETKWLYIETPLTGPGSIMPFIPVPSTIRAGAQPAQGHSDKWGLVFSGDFPGVTVETAWAPNIKSTLSYVQIREALFRTISPTSRQAESWAVLASVAVTPLKGLTIKPTYAYADYDGGNSGSLNSGVEPKGGFDPTATPGRAGSHTTRRHTFGAEAKWNVGAFRLEPSLFWQLGEQGIAPVLRNGQVKNSVDVRSWIFDGIAGYRLGPLDLSTRFMYTPGQEAQQRVENGSDVAYYQSLHTGFAYMTGWTEIQTASVGYNNALLAGCRGCVLWQNPSYDKYGRIMWAVKADYALTPALNLYGIVNASWTDKDVDENGIVGTTGITPDFGKNTRGENRYLGTELDLGMTWRFAPNTQLDLVWAYLFAGSAFDQAGSAANQAAGVVNDAKDVYKAVARIRFTF